MRFTRYGVPFLLYIVVSVRAKKQVVRLHLYESSSFVDFGGFEVEVLTYHVLISLPVCMHCKDMH